MKVQIKVSKKKVKSVIINVNISAKNTPNIPNKISTAAPWGNLNTTSMTVYHYIETCPVQAEVSINFSRDPNMVVDQTITGELGAHSSHKQSARQNIMI